MNKKLEELFGQVSNFGNKEAVGQFAEMMDTPDEQFDAIWPVYKEMFTKVLKSEDFQNQQKNMIATFPDLTDEDIAEEKAKYKEILDDLSNEPDISDSKKEFLALMLNSIIELHEQLIVSGRTRIEVKVVKLREDAIIPTYAHPTDAGADVYAVEETKIAAGETKAVATGIAVAIPAGYEIQVRPRSSLSLNTGLRIANAPGTIDADYRGEIGVIVTNTGDTDYVIDKNMKIAQLVIAPTPMIKWDEVKTVEELGTTKRGEGGFGSTDVVGVNSTNG